MFDNPYYQEYLRKKEEEWEALCRRCGACCGAYEDPCRHLKKGNDEKYSCEIYNDRFGERESASGKKFKCVHIRQILSRSWFNDRLCVYKINLTRLRGSGMNSPPCRQAGASARFSQAFAKDENPQV